jgi:putative ABC transport system permease protein
MAVVCDLEGNLGGISQPESVGAEAVSSNFLSMLGIRPLIGRDFVPAEDRAGTAPVVLLSYRLWQTHFAGDRQVLGQTISLDGRPVTIVGVLPGEFRATDSVSLLEPVGMWLTNNAEPAPNWTRSRRG